METIQGQDVDTSLFSKIRKQAKIDRLETNKNFNQCVIKLGCIRS